MPVIEHSNIRMSKVVNYSRERTLVSSADGTHSLTIKEIELHPGWEGRLHTHPTDTVVMVTSGAIQIVLNDEVTTVRAGATMIAPPGTPHKLVNQLWIPATMLVTYPADELETSYLE